MAKEKKSVSMSVIKRLPRYYRFLGELKKNNITRISSKELSQRMGFTASQIRQDLNCFGGFGQQGYGYNVEQLQNEIGAILGVNNGFKTILFGCALLAAMFLTFYFLTTLYSTIHPVMFVCFALVGFAWAAINVNSLPMVLEMCRGSDIGKFTGYYYTFSMAAQVVTPVLAGTLMRHISYRVLFPYAALFVGASFVTMCFVRHGDSRAEAKGGLAAFEDMDD